MFTEQEFVQAYANDDQEFYLRVLDAIIKATADDPWWGWSDSHFDPGEKQLLYLDAKELGLIE